MTDQQEAFDTLNTTFTTEPVVQYSDPRHPIRVETDASGFAISAILSQSLPAGIVPEHEDWRPIAYCSKNMEPAELNYEAHDAELLAIVKELFGRKPSPCRGPVGPQQPEIFHGNDNSQQDTGPLGASTVGT